MRTLAILLILPAIVLPLIAAAPTPTPAPMHPDSDAPMAMPTATPPPPGNPSGSADTRTAPPAGKRTGVVSVAAANVRTMPHRYGSGVIEVLKQGAVVQVYKKLPDGSWIGVMAPDEHHGWMHRSVIDVDPAVLNSLPVATDDLMAMDMPMATPTPTPTSVPPTPTPAPLAAAGTPDGAMPPALLPQTGAPDSAVQIIALPALDAPPPTVPLVLTLQVCVDQNGSKTCDEGEGVDRLPVVAADPDRATVLGRELTNASGVAQLQVQAAAGATITVSVPSLASVQTVTAPATAAGGAARLAVQAIVLPPAAAQPWPLP